MNSFIFRLTVKELLTSLCNWRTCSSVGYANVMGVVMFWALFSARRDITINPIETNVSPLKVNNCTPNSTVPNEVAVKTGTARLF